MEVERPLRSTTPTPSTIPNEKAMDPAGRALRRRRKCRNICLAVLAVLLLVIVIIIILAFTVFKPKKPVTTVDDVSLGNLRFSVDLARLRVLLNLTLNIDLSVKNPNRVGFKYTDSYALLNYRGQQVGDVPIPAGKIGSDSTSPMNLTLTIMADRFATDSNFFSDVTGGRLPLNTVAKIRGKVNLLNMFKIRVVSTTSCFFTVFLSNSSVSDQMCQYKTKF